MPIIKFFLTFIFIAIAIQGCVMTHHFVEGEKSAKIRSMYSSHVRLCQDGKIENLASGKVGEYLEIPAETRVSVGIPMYYSVAGTNYKCTPFISFMPREGQSYLIDAYVKAPICKIELVREQRDSPRGIAVEESMGPSSCHE